MATRKRRPQTLSDQLRDRIERDGRSAYELASDAEVDRSVLSRFLAGQRSITLETADRLAAVLRIRFADDRG
jgi:plasmid maintenance system antidote protein VapI